MNDDLKRQILQAQEQNRRETERLSNELQQSLKQQIDLQRQIDTIREDNRRHEEERKKNEQKSSAVTRNGHDPVTATMYIANSMAKSGKQFVEQAYKHVEKSKQLSPENSKRRGK